MIRTVPIQTQSHMAIAIREYVAEEQRREDANPALRNVLRTSMHMWLLTTLAARIEEEYAQSNVVQFPYQSER